MSPPRRTTRCAWPWCVRCRAGVSSDSIAERERDARVERETPTMDTDTAMRWTRRSASRDADGCLWAGYGLGGRLKTRITFIPFCAPRNTPTFERHGAPPGFTYREGRGATSLPPTSREERLRDEPFKRKERPCCACNGLVVKLSNDSPELRSLPPRKQRTLFSLMICSISVSQHRQTLQSETPLHKPQLLRR